MNAFDVDFAGPEVTEPSKKREYLTITVFTKGSILRAIQLAEVKAHKKNPALVMQSVQILEDRKVVLDNEG